MTDPVALCDDCGGAGEKEAGVVCPTCEGYGTDPEASITDEPPDDDEDGLDAMSAALQEDSDLE